jgi:hypothetical protein
MNGTLVRPPDVSVSAPSGSLLLVEPDAQRAGMVRHMLRTWTAVDVRTVALVAEAIRAISEHIPDLVMTSPLLAPADETALWTHIRRMPEASHVQIINLPYSIDTGGSAAGSNGRVFQFLRRPTASRAGDSSTFRDEIWQYLARGVARRLDASSQRLLTPSPREGAAGAMRPSDTGPVRREATGSVRECERRRASRRAAADLPGSWIIRLPWDSDVKLVDISNSGVLFESASQISPGITLDLRILGEQRNVCVPARMVRSVARVDALGTKYRTAAAFGREIRLVDFDAEAGLSSPRVLTDLLIRALGDVDRPSTSADVSARFEAELRKLLPGRDIQIRPTPAPRHGSESIYFTAGSNRILQVTYDSGSAPSEMEFKLLKTAANLAAVALEIAQMSERTA